jgi:hypothetical protein
MGEAEFRAPDKILGEPVPCRLSLTAFEILSHYYLGQGYERTGKRDQACSV